MRLDRILIGLDFSDASRLALRTAASLGTPATRLTVLHVIPFPSFVVLDWVYTPPAEELGRLTTASDEVMRRWVTELEVPVERVRFDTRPGEPAAELIRASAEHDLVVVGTHGRRGASRFLLGSVAERVVRGAHAPVLVARSPDSSIKSVR